MDDILLLSDGHPICGQCNYSCQICNLPILEEAIMTGDESYHASCFTCRSCNSRIEELVFAKTSQGIYCMPCHNERVARSRRHADNKRRTKNKDGTRSSRSKAAIQDKGTPTDPAPASAAVGAAPSPAVPTSISSSLPPTDNGRVVPSSQSQDSHYTALASDAAHSAGSGQTETLSRPSASSRSDGLRVSEDHQTRSSSSHREQLASPSPSKRDFPASPQLSPALPASAGLSSPRPNLGSDPVALSPSLSPNVGRPGTATGGPTLRELRENLSGRSLRPTTADSLAHQSPSHGLSAGRDSTDPHSDPPRGNGAASPFAASGGGTPALSVNNGFINKQQSSTTTARDKQRDIKRRSSDPDTRAVAEALGNLTTSGSEPQGIGRNSAVGLGIEGNDRSNADVPQEVAHDPDESLTPTNSNSLSNLQSAGAQQRRPSVGSVAAGEGQPDAVRDGGANSVSAISMPTPDPDSDGDTPVRGEVKRASRLSLADPAKRRSTIGQAKPPTGPALAPPSIYDKPDSTGLTPSFSFYDPDLMNLMDSFGHFDTHDPIQLSSPMGDRFSMDGDRPDEQSRGSAFTPESKTSLSSTDGSSVASSSKTGADAATKQDTAAADVTKSPSGSSIHTISAKMRESMKQASGGQVAMDTSFIETILQELEDTKGKMKSLQGKYDRMKRASAHAAQGFSHAKTEFEQQVQAREEAELEMLMLRQKLADQATKLAATSRHEKQQELLATRSQDVKVSLEDMSKNLAKLTVERDMTAAEVAELMAVQEGKSKHAGQGDTIEETGKALQSRLSVRLDGVKAKYRKEIAELTDKRNELLLEIEDLRQSRDVYLEETEALNARNEELNILLSKLSSRVETLSAAQAVGRQLAPSQGSGSNTASRGGFGFGFGGSRGKNHVGSPSMSSTQENLLGSSSGHSNQDSDAGFSRGGINLHSQAAAIARAEAIAAASATSAGSAPQPAQAKKFKWMKPMAKSAGQGLVSALPLGHTVPPVPPKNGPSSGGLPQPQPHLQQQALVQQHIQQQQQQQREQQMQQQQRDQSQDMVVREHSFAPTNILRPTRCFSCQKNMWGQSEVRCNTCGQVCHTKCLPSLTISCSQPYLRSDEAAPEPVGPSMFGRSLVDQAHSESRDVPLIVEKCIQAVEANGMDYEGIYRKSGGTSQLKIITQLFERGQRFDLDDQDRFNDVSAVTSVLKNYFRELPEPLLTYELHDQFIEAAQNGEYRGNPEAKEAKMKELVDALPRSHRETLRTLCSHLGRVAKRAEENRMNARNLGVVFGPTLMRSADASREFSEMGQKSMTIEWLCDHSDIFDA